MTALLVAIGLTAASTAGAASASPSTPAATSGGSSGSGSSSGTPAKATFGLQPATPGQQDSRSILTFQMSAGGHFSDHFAVLNFGTIPLNLQLYSADVDNAADGSLAAAAENTKPIDAGAWVHIAGGAHSVQLAPASAAGPARLVLPVSITVPANATPGDHAAAVIASLATIGKNPKGENVRLLQRVALRVFIRVNGAIRSHLSVIDVTLRYRGTLNPIGGGSAVLTYTLRNDGNVKLAARQAVALSGWFGNSGRIPKIADIPLLLPGSALPVRLVIPEVRLPVHLSASITLTPLRLSTDADPYAAPTVAKAATWAVPWPLLGAVALLIAVVVAALLYTRHRRRSRPQRGGRHSHGKPRPSGPGGPVSSAHSTAPARAPLAPVR